MSGEASVDLFPMIGSAACATKAGETVAILEKAKGKTIKNYVIACKKVEST